MALTYEQMQLLRQKGWQPHQITRATGIIGAAQEVKSDAIKFLDMFVYWGILLLAIVGNFILSIVVIPILLAFDDLSLVIAVAIIAVAFGTLLDVIIREVEHFRRNKLIIPELFIPAIALINIYIITTLTNNVAELVQLPTHNPWIVSIMYVCGFSLPHFLLKWQRNMRNARVM